MRSERVFKGGIIVEDIINNICCQLKDNVHVVGIILKEEGSGPCHLSREEEEGNIDLCVISRETGNQKTKLHMEGYRVCLEWHLVDEFKQLINCCKQPRKTYQVLYDKLGLMEEVMQ